MLPFLFITVSLADTPQQISQWIRSRADAGQTDQIRQFGTLPDGYPDRLTGWVRGQLARSAALALARFQEGSCQESSRLRVLAPGLMGVSEGATADAFEGSMFRLESTGCLPGVSLDEVASIYHSEDFRLAEMPGLDGLTITSGRTCLFSDAVPGILQSTRFCLKTGQRTSEALHLTHAALSENQQPAGQHMYLREEVVVLATIPDGVGIYRVTYTRAQDIGPAARVVLERTARSTQGRLYRALEEWLSR